MTELFAAAQIGILRFHADCLVVEANAAMAALSGWSTTELQGRKACSELFTAGPTGETLCTAICPRHAGQRGTASTRLLLRRKDGRLLPVMVSMAPLTPDGTGFALFVWDVSAIAEAEREVAHRRQQLEEMAAIGRELAAATAITQRMDQILERIRLLLGIDLVAWGEADENRKYLTWLGAAGPGGLPGTQFPLTLSRMGRVLLQGRTYVTMRWGEEQAALGDLPAALLDPPLTTALAVPFLLHEGRQGVLFCANGTRVNLTEEDVMIFTHLGGYLATAVENAALLEGARHMATLEERQRLAAEMHDGFGQMLTYFGLRVHLMGKAARRGDTTAILHEVENLKRVLEEAHSEVRGAIFQLRESAPPRAPLADRWGRLLDDFAARTGIQVFFTAEDGVMERLPEPVQAQLTRVLQEALANVRNHSGAYSLRVTVRRQGHHLVVEAVDDGCGFEIGAAPADGRHHFGLTLMQERAAAIGASLEIKSARGRGTSMTMRWPYAAAEGESV